MNAEREFSSLFRTPLADRAPAAGWAGEIVRTWLTRRGHAKARFVAHPLYKAELDCSFVCPADIQVVHLHRLGTFIESYQCVDHRLASKRNFNLIIRCDAESGAKHHRGQLLSIANNFHRAPFALKPLYGRRSNERELACIGCHDGRFVTDGRWITSR